MSVLTDRQFEKVWRLAGNDPVHRYVETGVGLGTSFNAAVKQPFHFVDGIEVSLELFNFAWAHTPNGPCSAIHYGIHQGSSPEILPRLIVPSERTMFWLDAHFEPPDHFSPEHGQCPLLAELRVIDSYDWKKKPIILIDDVSAFISDAWWRRYASPHLIREQWPTFGQIYDILNGIEHRWHFEIDGEILYCW